MNDIEKIIPEDDSIIFWSIVYVDDEGDDCIGHALMRRSEVRAFLEKCNQEGRLVTMYEITPPKPL